MRVDTVINLFVAMGSVTKSLKATNAPDPAFRLMSAIALMTRSEVAVTEVASSATP